MSATGGDGAAVGVVVITYNSASDIDGLLDSLPAAMADVEHRVVVVDNGSTDDTRSLVSARGDCTLVESDNVGYAAGFNRGVDELGDVGQLLILNPDLRVEPGAVPVMQAVLAEPGVGVVVPRLRDERGDVQLSLRREPTLPRALGLSRLGPFFSEHYGDPADYARPQTVDWATGAIMLMRRDCYDAVGGWDESYFLYSEETDFCLQAAARGWATRYTPDAEALHVGGGSGQSDATHSMQVVNRVRLYRRRHGAVASYAYLLATAFLEATRWARGRPHSRAAALAVLRPSRRPDAIHASDALLPT